MSRTWAVIFAAMPAVSGVFVFAAELRGRAIAAALVNEQPVRAFPYWGLYLHGLHYVVALLAIVIAFSVFRRARANDTPFLKAARRVLYAQIVLLFLWLPLNEALLLSGAPRPRHLASVQVDARPYHYGQITSPAATSYVLYACERWNRGCQPVHTTAYRGDRAFPFMRLVIEPGPAPNLLYEVDGVEVYRYNPVR